MKQTVLSIVVPTYNAECQLERFFLSLNKQIFPKNRLEILMVDGGSSDNSLFIAKKFHIKVIHNPLKLAEPGVALGFSYAKGDLIMVLATDNIFADNNALQTIVNIFDNKNVVAAFPKHETAPGDSLYSRYINTFTDPFSHFVYGNAANARTFQDIYTLVLHTKTYDIYDYSSAHTFPLIALAQGFTIRRSFLSHRKEQHDDVLSVYDIIQKNKFIAYAWSVSLFHYTASSLRQFSKKQERAVENALVRGNSGITKRDQYLTDWQRMKMYLFIPYSLSIIFPLIVGFFRFILTGERMWLWHWFVSFLSAIMIVRTVMCITLRRCKSQKSI